MSHEPDSLLECDRLEEVLEEKGPPQPVLVVQYRTRTVSWVFIFALAITLALGSLLIYHRREVDRLRAQAMEARHELQRLAAMTRAEEGRADPRAADPSAKAAMDPRPSASAAARPIAISSGAGSSATTQPPPSPGAATTTRPVLTPEPAKADPAMARTQLPLKPDPASATELATPITAAAQVTDSTSPFEDLSGNDRDDRAGVPTAATDPAPVSAATMPPAAPTTPIATTTPAPVPAPAATATATTPAAAVVTASPGPASAGPEEKAGPTGPVVVAAEPPLPSKEETERQIRLEAARKQAEDDQRLARQQQELQALKEDQRTRFRDDLRRILREQGNRAGREIEALSERAGRDDDPDLRARANRVLGMTGAPQSTKVRRLRDIGMPEAVILDYIANQLDRNLGTRNGPRSRDEVWVIAARRLLTYELTPTPRRPADGRRAAVDPRRRSTRPTAAGPAPARGIPRTP